jgi:EAL domain-containing protein (putative c-di-GMP-specific phosphodiesterase class I)
VSSGDLDADVARDTVVEALLRGYAAEPGDTLADAFNAVTRAAHEGLLDEAQRWRMERAAGALLPVLARRAAEA